MADKRHAFRACIDVFVPASVSVLVPPSLCASFLRVYLALSALSVSVRSLACPLACLCG